VDRGKGMVVMMMMMMMMVMVMMVVVMMMIVMMMMVVMMMMIVMMVMMVMMTMRFLLLGVVSGAAEDASGGEAEAEGGRAQQTLLHDRHDPQPEQRAGQGGRRPVAVRGGACRCEGGRGLSL